MFMCPQIRMVEPAPHLMVLGGGAFWRSLESDEVMRVEPQNGITVFVRRG